MRIKKKAARNIQNHGKVCCRVRDFEHYSGELDELPTLLPATPSTPHTILTRKKTSFLLDK